MTPRDQILQALAEAIGAPAADLAEDADLLGAGVDSLALAEMVESIEKRLGVTVPDEVIARLHTPGHVHAEIGRLLHDPADRIAHYTHYLRHRPSSPHRHRRFQAAAGLLIDGGLGDADTVVDVAAGWTDLDTELRSRGWRGRYVPVDAAIDGVDLEQWVPPASAEWFVALEILEHLARPARLAAELIANASCGVIVSTPDPAAIDVAAMCPDHRTPIPAHRLREWGLPNIEARFLYRFPGDGLLAYRYGDTVRDKPAGRRR